MKISNNAIVVLLVFAIGVSVYNFAATIPFGDFSGMVTSGKTNVTVESLASITFVSSWNETLSGNGTTTAGSTTVIATNQENSNSFRNGSYCNDSTFSGFGTGTRVKPLCIRNDGNDETTCVKINAGAAPSGWITCSGTCQQTPNATVKGYDNDTSACTSVLRGSWQQLNATVSNICDALNTTKTMGVDMQLTLPQNTQTGQELTTTITITGSGDC